MTAWYRWKVRWLKTPAGNRLWRYLRARRGQCVGRYQDLEKLVRSHAPGRTFADIGCMWGIDGAHAFLAEQAGATRVKGVDVFGPTPLFLEHHRQRKSQMEFILGDITDPATVQRIGVADVVLCSGVLYHHPSPFDVLAALRRICHHTLILRTATIPEVDGLPHAAIYFPLLPPAHRRLWDLRTLGVGRQVGITTAFDPKAGYGNWFWGLTPSCVVALLQTAGFRVEERLPEPFAQTLICRTIAPPLTSAPKPSAA